MKRRLIVFAGLAVTACGQRGSNVEYHANGGQTVTIGDAKSSKVTAEIGASAKMPTDLPSWTPAYPGSTVVMAQTQNGVGVQGTVENVVLQSADDLGKVSAFYDQQIAKAGVRSMHSVTSGDVSVRMVETPSGIVGVNVAKSDEGGSTISITRIPQK